MRIRSVRRLPAAVGVATAVTGTLIWAPAASAQSPEPTPSTSTAPRNAAETGGVAILKKDPAGDVLAGATFTLFDSSGKEAGSGKTNAEGQLAFADLAPGVYRLKEVAKSRGFAISEEDAKPNRRVVRP
ncbi:MSCRAMM family protein [Streptomyces chattanoogensis]|uniref:MSCRAMM family protein n=1 Tax=Streptomyces chattanoogensis TaxID=66876 RepID=UPI000B200D0B|nr:prealbumin-like fold domain-containing protein [Streptomyces chattanoogensis]